jgi:hypothetical protein
MVGASGGNPAAKTCSCISAVERSGMSPLRDGQIVEFDLFTGRNGRMAASNSTPTMRSSSLARRGPVD